MLVDSNILVYAINSSSPKHKRAQKFLQENIGKLYLSHQNIFETLRVLTHPKFSSPMSPSDAINAVNPIMKVCRIIAPDYKTHHLTLELIKKHKLSADRIFDAYLVATAVSNDIKQIATDNEKDFKKFGINIYNPFADAN